MLPLERQQKIESLFRQYGRGVGSYVLARVGNADAAETITSNVFLSVVRRIEQCRSSPAAWLWSIVRTELARYFRQRRPEANLPETHPDPSPLPPETAERHEIHARMRLALERLTPEQQRIIYLKFFLDVPNLQIASELHLSASNVGVIVHRAVKRLRELMEEPGTPAAPADQRSNAWKATAAHRATIAILLVACMPISFGGADIPVCLEFASAGAYSLLPSELDLPVMMSLEFRAVGTGETHVIRRCAQVAVQTSAVAHQFTFGGFQ